MDFVHYLLLFLGGGVAVGTLISHGKKYKAAGEKRQLWKWCEVFSLPLVVHFASFFFFFFANICRSLACFQGGV